MTHDSDAVIEGLWRSLAAVREEADDVELIIVDSGSKHGAPAPPRDGWPDARVVTLDGNRGFAAGVNAGVECRVGHGPVLVLNADVRPTPGSIRALLTTLSKPGIGIAVPRLRNGDGRLLHSLRREPTLLRALVPGILGDRLASLLPACSETVTNADAYNTSTTADWATGAVMLISPGCLEAVGPWDESFFLYSEETDFALRARDAGFALALAPQAEFTHLGGESSTSAELWSLLQTNRVRLDRKRHGFLHARAFQSALIIGAALRSLLGRPRDQRALATLLRPIAQSGHEQQASPALGALGEPSQGPPGYICFAAQDWWYHNRAHSDFQLMRNIAAKRRVLCVNSIGMRMPTRKRSTNPTRRILRKMGSIARYVRRPIPSLHTFYVMTPLMAPLYDSRRARSLNAALIRLQVRIVARALGISTPCSPPVVFVTIPTAWDVIQGMPRRNLIFNRSDRHSAFPEVNRKVIESLERRLLETADHVLYVSRALMDDDKDLVGHRAIFLDHGVDFQRFAIDGPQPHHDVVGLRRPIVGFFGGFDDYIIDFELIEKIARAIPDVSVLLVGDATCSMDSLVSLPNVRWTGYRPYEEIPAIGSNFNVAIMPWLNNEWIRYCNPIKAKEYLALGLPVVTTPYPEAYFWQPYLVVASTHEDFIAQVQASLALPSTRITREARRAAVVEYSWETRAASVIKAAEPTRVYRAT